MENVLTIRDQLAMSMPVEAMPKLNDSETILYVSESYGLNWTDDPVEQIDWSIEFQTIIRYKYADAMLKQMNS